MGKLYLGWIIARSIFKFFLGVKYSHKRHFQRTYLPRLMSWMSLADWFDDLGWGAGCLKILCSLMTTDIPGSDKSLTNPTRQWAAVTTHLSAIRLPPQPPIWSPFVVGSNIPEKEQQSKAIPQAAKLSINDSKGKTWQTYHCWLFPYRPQFSHLVFFCHTDKPLLDL